MPDIDVSFVMTVYNKEKFLPSVLKALLNQSGLKNPEVIFVDDVSQDRSVEISEEMTKGLPNVQIVRNSKNQGISIRINQGIALAHGEYVRMLDSDDIFPIDSTERMIALAEEYDADMVYGTFTKTGKPAEELTNEFMKDGFKYYYRKDALRAMLDGRFTRMGQLIKRDVLQKAGGADEDVFIQDETIPLRAAFYANGIVKMFANVVLVPQEDGNLSGNKIQLDHDRFLAYYDFIKLRPHLDCDIRAKLNVRAVSAYWKYIRKISKCPTLTMTFPLYLYTKLFKPQPDMKKLDKMAQVFKSIKTGVLRPKKA